MTFMKAEPLGARDANRMIVVSAAFARGLETAPGNDKAADASIRTNTDFQRFIVASSPFGRLRKAPTAYYCGTSLKK
jgi:hypothetical protein